MITNTNIRYFYRFIVRVGDHYRIKHNNKDYGEFNKLSDALYERDCLVYCNFDYDLLVECDLENKYENMELPPFPEKRPRGKIKNIIDKSKIEGKIEFNHKINKFTVTKGDEDFGSYDTMTEAYYAKKILMENKWNPESLNILDDIRNQIYSKGNNVKEKILPKYCPKCGNKLKNNTEICPYCGIRIDEY